MPYQETILHPAIIALIKQIRQVSGVENVLLFGSRARGDAHPRSDVDLAVKGASISPAGWAAILELVENAETLLSIDCVWLDKASEELKGNILKWGKPVSEGETPMVDMDQRWQTSLRQLEIVLERLGQALAEPENNPLRADATIQRFESAIEMFWKTFKHLLALEGKETLSPKESLQAAYQLGWIEDEAVWLGMLKDRNLTSHAYHEALAAKIVANIQANFPEMKRTYQFLEEHFQGAESK